VLTPQEAKRQKAYVLPPMHLRRGDPGAAMKSAPRRTSGEFYVGGQEQFYLEGQISYAVPKEDGCLHLYCSTQHPTEMQHVVAHALELAANQVTVEMRRMGGGFGGKESQSALFACVAAVAAQHTGRPVKIRLDRDDDFMITGKRHCFHYEYEVGYGDDGTIRAAKVEMAARAGFSADLSGPVCTRAVCHFDNAYFLPDVDILAIAGKTNTQSNTAFRGFGGPQGAIAIEYILDNVARELGRDPLDVRKANFYGKSERNVTPYSMTVEDNVIPELVAELETSSDYRQRRRAIHAFNASSPVLKKGIALTPVKFGISFNVVHYNQAGALVHVYTDGSALVSHGGTEMGQGLNTKVAQVVAHELGIGLSHVRSSAADTSKVANTSATAASTGSDLNGKAGQDAARQIKRRLADFAAATYGGRAQDVAFAADFVTVGGKAIPFPDLVQQAYRARVQLWSDGFYATPKLHWDAKTMSGRPFFYFAYGAAVSEVVVDTLTGEFKLLRADLLHDAGDSINPAIDIGQVEGAFIQGMGWLTTEELWWNKDGVLMTHAPSTYKIPSVNDCPADLRTKLYKNSNVEDTIHRSKATGEPPLLLPFSVFFAIRDAISSVGGHRVNPPLDAPATGESILKAINAVRAAAPDAAG
jgi:xanthine dehydrogenase large subunit